MNKVIELIESDPAIAARVLGAANSPLYGYSRKVESIPRAAIVLGLRTISNMAISFSAGEVFKGSEAHKATRQSILEHSVGCAVVGRILARATGNTDASGAFLTGILHDIGKLALIDLDADAYVPYLEKMPTEEPLTTEDTLFGANHADIGKRYVTKMHMPPHFSTAIAEHHIASPEIGQLTGIVAISNQLSKIWLEGRTGIAFDSGRYAQFEQQALESFEAVKCNFQN